MDIKIDATVSMPLEAVPFPASSVTSWLQRGPERDRNKKLRDSRSLVDPPNSTFPLIPRVHFTLNLQS